MSGHAAYLRVYEPLAAFSGEQRERWRAYAEAGTAPDPALGAAIERTASLRALTGAAPPTVPVVDEQAYVIELDGVTLVCPWSTRLRALEALEEFVSGLPDEVAGAFLPLGIAHGAGAAVDAWRAEHPTERSHQQSSAWHVPLRWFVLVEADERSLQLGAPTPAGSTRTGRATGRRLVYRTAMSRARRRTARALEVLRRTVDDGTVTAGVEDLGRWLEEFHPRSLVELDYGGLVHLQDDAALSSDDSPAQVAAALAALGRGEPAQAAAAYARVSARIKLLQAVESSN